MGYIPARKDGIKKKDSTHTMRHSFVLGTKPDGTQSSKTANYIFTLQQSAQKYVKPT